MFRTLLIGSGGSGCTFAKAYAVKYSLPVILLDNHPFKDEDYTMYQDCIELGQEGTLDRSRLRDAMHGFSFLFFVTSLGGDSFKLTYDLVSQTAAMLHIPVITLCTVPFVFETERRERAFSFLSELPSDIQNIFLIDLQKTITEDCMPVDFFEKNNDLIAHFMHVLVSSIEQCPFFTLCTDACYTFAIGDGPTCMDAVSTASANPYFEVGNSSGKVLVCVDKTCSEYEKEQVVSFFMAHNNVVPEFVNNLSLEGHSVLLFIPIFYRRHE